MGIKTKISVKNIDNKGSYHRAIITRVLAILNLILYFLIFMVDKSNEIVNNVKEGWHLEKVPDAF